ncbi:hypothetical protein OAP33_05325, partial [Flavobacteriaceae bacterium]|nr:hypothetical protein [Flavobacteriaceae bacterium]
MKYTITFTMYIFFNMLTYCSAQFAEIPWIAQSARQEITLRWLLQWGSPLTIPNRAVKPISA